MNTFNNLLLRTKLAVIFAVILFSAVCFSITSIFIAYRLSQKTDDIYRNNLIPIALLGEVRESIPQSIVLVRDIIIFSGNPSIVEERRAALNAITQHSNFLLTEYEPRISSEVEKRKYEEFKIHLTAFREVRTQILTAALNGNFEEAKVLLLSAQYITSSEKVVQDLHDIDHINREQADEFVAQNHLDAGHARTVILIVSALTVFWIVLSILLLMRSINAPIAELRAKAERIAQGDLEQIIHLSRTDEIGILASSFNSMAASIRIGIEKLQQEKSAIEQKIEEAIRHSEAERLALQESAQVLQQGMKLFADGDLTVEIAQQRSEVMNQVIISFNRSVREIRGLISQVKDAMETTNLTANQISSAAQQMAVTAQEQAAQTTQISGSVEEMSRSVTESAQSTAKTSALATQSGTQAQNGQTVMQHTIQKIHTITTVVDEAAMVVRRLGDSSVEIGEIIQVIEEIADQTNLLALNAAIEAARAGDQGRGFAVVADEVRKLAERTSQATKQIADTIRQIQNDTTQAVSGIVNGSSTASAGLQYAEEAGTVFTSIVESVHHVQQLVHDIALVGEQQSTTGEEIAKSIEQVSSSIEETSVTINQVADDAERLRRMMGDVLSLIERFALDDIANQQHSNKKLLTTTSGKTQVNNKR